MGGDTLPMIITNLYCPTNISCNRDSEAPMYILCYVLPAYEVISVLSARLRPLSIREKTVQTCLPFTRDVRTTNILRSPEDGSSL